MTLSSSAASADMKRARQLEPESEEDKRAKREHYGKLTLHYAKQFVAAAVEVKSVGTQTDETLSFDNAIVELLCGKVIAIDKEK